MESISFELEQVFSQKFIGLIWRIMINEETAYIAIENRELTSKKVSISVLNYKTGIFHFKEKLFAEPLNANLAYASPKSILLKLNESSESFESKGLIAVDIYTGEIMWEHYNLCLNDVKSYGIQVFDPRIFPRKYLWIDHLKGEIIQNLEINKNKYSNLLFPKMVDNNIIPKSIIHGDLQGEVFFMNFNEKNLISFHERFEGMMQQRLIVYQGDNILLDNILISDIQKLQPESFFILNKQLFYIRNKDEIVSYFV
ncbi:DUF4905 domain-containing protein [Daejeonella sp.]|jgi:hypothetical protein|uniref:DUF4905 domain-containing protein n=1 Tax=Daejeonella sp. TaxID=2805397 RepID=UPI0037838ABB